MNAVHDGFGTATIGNGREHFVHNVVRLDLDPVSALILGQFHQLLDFLQFFAEDNVVRGQIEGIQGVKQILVGEVGVVGVDGGGHGRHEILGIGGDVQGRFGALGFIGSFSFFIFVFISIFISFFIFILLGG